MKILTYTILVIKQYIYTITLLYLFVIISKILLGIYKFSFNILLTGYCSLMKMIILIKIVLNIHNMYNILRNLYKVVPNKILKRRTA